MDSNLKQIKEFVEKYKDTLVIYYEKVVYLRGYLVTEEDYYYTLETFGYNPEIINTSAVVDPIPLKGKIDKKKYDMLFNVFELNKGK